MFSLIPYIIVIIILVGVTYLIWLKQRHSASELAVDSINSFDSLVRIVLRDYTEVIKMDRGIRYRDWEYEAARKNKEVISKSLKKCVSGDNNAKKIVLKVTRDIIEKHLLTLEDCNKIFDFTNILNLTPEQKFEILTYELSKVHGKNVMRYLNSIYHFVDLRIVWEGDDPRREFDDIMLDEMFIEQVPYTSLDYEQALDVLTILVYQVAKGFGKIETIRDLNIDGLELGTVGSIMHSVLGTNPHYVIERSLSIQIEAQWVHLSFVDFGTVEEIKRIIVNISNIAGSEALTVKAPLKVVEDSVGNRITCIRPDVGATWGLFLRSFSAGIVSVKEWLRMNEIKNGQLPDRLLYFLAKAGQNVAFTGAQNTGKTTLMKGYIEYYDQVNIRIIEMSFELNPNEIYPGRNIFSVKPTTFATTDMVQSILRKTDSWLTLVGEIADSIMAANTMKIGLVGSNSTIFSYHGIDYRGLIDGLTGDLLSSGMYSNENSAQQLVLDVVKHNVHTNFYLHYRVIEYIEEIVKGETIVQYPPVKNSFDIREAIDQSTAMNREHYQRTTDRVKYSRKEIIRFNKRTMSYEAVSWYTPERFAAILGRLPDNEVNNFIEFFKANWSHCMKDKEVS